MKGMTLSTNFTNMNKKIRSRAPLRLGLAGGGTDVSPYSEDFGGAILNMTIDRYAYTYIEPSGDNKIHFIATDLECEEEYPLDLVAVESKKLVLHSAVYKRMIREFGNNEPFPVTVYSSVDAPAGSGLGSSSALVVSMVEAYRTLLEIPLGAYEVAHLAYEIERVDLGLAGGKQDQYAAAFGGINFVEFLANDRVIVNPLRVKDAIRKELETSLILCFSGVSRRSEEIILQQKDGMTSLNTKTISSLHQLKADAVEMKQALLRGNILQMATILNRSWAAKKATATGVSTSEIDQLYDVAMQEGAYAGKVSGAGGGGFIMFLVAPEKRLHLIRKLNEAGGNACGVYLTAEGAEAWTCRI